MGIKKNYRTAGQKNYEADGQKNYETDGQIKILIMLIY
jgi:hypothetical protein